MSINILVILGLHHRMFIRHSHGLHSVDTDGLRHKLRNRLSHNSWHTLHGSSLALVELSGAASSHLVVALELASELGLDVSEDLVEEGVDLGLVEEVNSVAQVLLLVVLEVSLVMNIFVLNLSDFFYLVIVDVKLLAVEGSLV
jgi:hypothetical protein